MCLSRILEKRLPRVVAVLMIYVGIALIPLETNTLHIASADHPEQKVHAKEN